MHLVARALSRALFSAGNSIPAKIAIIAITTSSSIKVNTLKGIRWCCLWYTSSTNPCMRFFLAQLSLCPALQSICPLSDR